jgi:hypothetical protein
MVSHQLDRIAELCTDVIVLNQGEVYARGTPADAISAYVQQHDQLRAGLTSTRIAFDPVQLLSDTVTSGDRFDVRVSGRVSDALNENVEPLAIRVRSLRTGSTLYSSGSRRLHLDLGQVGDFDVIITLQANLPAGSYMVEVGAQDLLKRKDFASAPSAMIQVFEGTGFKGSVQLNAAMRLVGEEQTTAQSRLGSVSSQLR